MAGRYAEPTMPDEHEQHKERPSSPTTPLPDRKGDKEHPQGWRVQPAPDGRGMPPEKPPGIRNVLGRRFLLFVLILFAINLWVSSLIPSGHERIRIPYSPTFIGQVKGGNVKSISSKGETIQGEFQHEFKYPPTGKDSKVSKLFDTEVPTFANTDALTAALQEGNVQANAKPAEEGRSLIANLLLGFGPTLLLVSLFVWFARRAARQGAGGGLMGFGKSGARRVEPSEQHVTFDDVAGIDEAKQELTEIVDFLRNPDKYSRLGGRIPRGVLLSGPPGTGKTLLARAVAGEAHAPFFSISASEFVEGIVGVGASRARLSSGSGGVGWWGRSSGWGGAACATSSSRRRRPRPRSSSSTSSTRSVARAPPARRSAATTSASRRSTRSSRRWTASTPRSA